MRLKDIHSLGEVAEGLLIREGVRTVADLAAQEPAALNAALRDDYGRISEELARSWITAARTVDSNPTGVSSEADGEPKPESPARATLPTDVAAPDLADPTFDQHGDQGREEPTSSIAEVVKLVDLGLRPGGCSYALSGVVEPEVLGLVRTSEYVLVRLIEHVDYSAIARLPKVAGSIDPGDVLRVDFGPQNLAPGLHRLVAEIRLREHPDPTATSSGADVPEAP